jgi:hypothetical protein
MSSLSPADTVLAAIRAVENRDYTTLAALYDPNVEFHWPPSSPYSGDHNYAFVTADATSSRDAC